MKKIQFVVYIARINMLIEIIVVTQLCLSSITGKLVS